MEPNRRHPRPASFFAGTLIFFIAAILSTELASAQTRIISLSGDLDFGRIPFHSSSQRTVAISNTGDSVLTISNLVYPALPASELVNFQGNWSGQIGPGGSRYVIITFTPMESALGGTNNLDFQGLLTVESDATEGTNTIAMSGVGVWQPSNNLPPVDFGTVAMGASHEVQLSLTNRGDIPITISNISSPEGFWTSIWPPLTSNMIAASSSANFYVLFNPTNVGEFRGDITISSDASEPAVMVVTSNGTITNSAEGFNQFTVSGTGTYPAGKFIGLFAPTNDPAFENSGYFEATCTAKGKLRATITLAGKRYPFSAQTSPEGTLSATIVRKHVPALNISLQYNVEAGGWTGTVDNGTWTASLKSYLAVHLSGNARRFGPVGSYAITIAGSTNSLSGPIAAGSGTLTTKVSNTVRITGELGDGTRFSQNSTLPPNIPFYAPLYHNRGAILGWISIGPQFTLDPPIGIIQPLRTNPPVTLPPIILTNVPIILEPIDPPLTNVPPIITPIEIKSHSSNPSPSADVTYKITGTLNWFKPAGIDPNYPDGFSFQTAVAGSVP